MPLPAIASRAEWLAARKELLAEEKALTKRRDELNTRRRELPMVEILEKASPHEVASLYRAADAYVMPTRGEGAALPISEAMASELPVIVTRDCVSYVADDNALLLDYEWREVSEQDLGELHAFRGHRWAEPDHGQLRDAMRRVIDEPAPARSLAVAGREHVLSSLSMPVVAERVIERLRALDAR